MKERQRLQRTTADRATTTSDRAFKASPFQTGNFAVQQKSAATPASKAELWENYQQATKLTQNRSNPPVTAPESTRSAIQTKLTIGQPGDKYEQEADSVADRVMAMSEPAQVQREELGEEEEELQMKPLADTISPLVQREELPEEEEDLQMKPEDHVVQREELPEEEEELQMKSLDNSIQREELPAEEEELQMKESATPSSQLPTDSLEDRLSSSKGGGSPLSDDVRSFMEPRFGADFSGVRVHTGSDAVQMNWDVNAQAFAHGQDIYFGAGKAPGKDALTAHELTHVVQQTEGVRTKLANNQFDRHYKQGANRTNNQLKIETTSNDSQAIQRKLEEFVHRQYADLLNTEALITQQSNVKGSLVQPKCETCETKDKVLLSPKESIAQTLGGKTQRLVALTDANISVQLSPSCWAEKFNLAAAVASLVATAGATIGAIFAPDPTTITKWIALGLAAAVISAIAWTINGIIALIACLESDPNANQREIERLKRRQEQLERTMEELRGALGQKPSPTL